MEEPRRFDLNRRRARPDDDWHRPTRGGCGTDGARLRRLLGVLVDLPNGVRVALRRPAHVLAAPGALDRVAAVVAVRKWLSTKCSYDFYSMKLITLTKCSYEFYSIKLITLSLFYLSIDSPY